MADAAQRIFKGICTVAVAILYLQRVAQLRDLVGQAVTVDIGQHIVGAVVGVVHTDTSAYAVVRQAESSSQACPSVTAVAFADVIACPPVFQRQEFVSHIEPYQPIFHNVGQAVAVDVHHHVSGAVLAVA